MHWMFILEFKLLILELTIKIVWNRNWRIDLDLLWGWIFIFDILFNPVFKSRPHGTILM